MYKLHGCSCVGRAGMHTKTHNPLWDEVLRSRRLLCQVYDLQSRGGEGSAAQCTALPIVLPPLSAVHWAVPGKCSVGQCTLHSEPSLRDCTFSPRGCCLLHHAKFPRRVLDALSARVLIATHDATKHASGEQGAGGLEASAPYSRRVRSTISEQAGAGQFPALLPAAAHNARRAERRMHLDITSFPALDFLRQKLRSCRT